MRHIVHTKPQNVTYSVYTTSEYKCVCQFYNYDTVTKYLR